MKTLVAGVGNVWMGDDGFGSEVARRLSGRLDGAVVRDFGIRALDLRYALEDCEHAIVVDVVRRGGEPGTVYILEPTAPAGGHAELPTHHGMIATEVITWAAERRDRGGSLKTLWLVGCEPESFGDEDEGRLGLSERVARAVDQAARVVEDLVRRIEGGASCTSSD